MIRSAAMIAMLLVIVVAGCTTSGPAASPTPTPGPPLTTAELRYRLIDTFGPLWFCDPDFYPIAVQDEADLSIKRFPEVQADAEAFTAILAHLGIPSGADFTADQS